MIKFWTHRYKLQPWTVIGAVAKDQSREGALLKCQWPTGSVGYADIFPWPELGDDPIETQLADLSKGKISPLIEQAIWMAKKDAALRAQGKNAFASGPKVKNHYLVGDFTKVTEDQIQEAKTSGFGTFKVKVGRAVDDEAKFILKLIRQHAMNIRLDFNSKIDFGEFHQFMNHFNLAEKARIEYAEDPFPWDLEHWKDGANFLPLALDNEYDKVDWEKITEPPPFKVVVIKPARQDVQKTLHWVNRWGLKMTISNSLDHPVGMAHACLVASELKKFQPNAVLDCGCLSLRAYKPNEFSTMIQMNGPYLKEIKGTGIGFDSLWGTLKWDPVR